MLARYASVSVRIALILVFIIGIFGTEPAEAGTIGFGWATRIGGTSYDQGVDMALDPGGNVYGTGNFTGLVDFDPGAGIYNLTSAGQEDIFIDKSNADGQFVWAKRIGGTASDSGYSLAVGPGGSVYTVGGFSGTVDFDPGAGTYNLSSAGTADIFVCKLDTNGDFVWAKNLGSEFSERAAGLTVDGSGNVYVTGYFTATVDFDPGVGITNLTSAGSQDIFIAKFDTNGSLVWAKNMGSSSDDRGASIYVDGSENVYSLGIFYGTADLDPGAGTFNLTSAGFFDIFISKLDASGSFVWAKGFGGTGSDSGLDIALDGNGKIYSTGYFQNTVDFDPGAGISNLTSAAYDDVFVSKLDNDGNFLWARSMGGGFSDDGYGIAVDGSGAAYTTGAFAGTVDFDPGVGTSNLVSAGNHDIFISKLNADGSFAWAKRMGGTVSDYGLSIALDENTNIYYLGSFTGTADFDPGLGTANLTSAGYNDISFSKLINAPQIYYVDQNAAGSNNGSSWANAFTDLQSALSIASSDDEIWVAAGTYTPTSNNDRTISFVLKNGVEIYGGFAGDETLLSQRDIKANVTTLSGDIGAPGNQGDNSYHVIVGSNTDNSAVLDGFTITGGSANSTDSATTYKGGGLYNVNGSPTLNNLTFAYNMAVWGAGLYNESSSNPKLTNVTLSWNSTLAGMLYPASGGAIFNTGSSPELRNVTINNNSAEYGGGLFNQLSSSPILVNVTLSSNSATDGGGIINRDATSSPSLTNVTMKGNSASGVGGAIANAGSPTIVNSILWDNNGGQIFNTPGMGTPVVTYSIVQGGYTGSGNLNTDPYLGYLQDNGGFTETIAIDEYSPAVDAGEEASCPETDQRGVSRPQGDQCDIGAYELEFLKIAGSAGVAGAIVNFGYGRYVVADNSGNYQVYVLRDWAGTIVPSKLNYSFTPSKREYSNLQSNQLSQNYTAAVPNNSFPYSMGSTWRVSVSSEELQSDDDSFAPTISANGRYVAYWSFAMNLVPGDGATDVVLRDNKTGETRAISVDSNGIPFECNSYNPSISADGRYVAFETCTASLWLVYVYDLHTGISLDVVRGTLPAISADGRYLAFTSTDNSENQFRIWVEDLQARVGEEISVPLTDEQPDGDSVLAAISADGRYVAFDSSATNLIADDTNGSSDIFLRDTQTDQTTRISVDSNGTQSNGDSFKPSISADGRYITFYSSATNLVDNDTNGVEDVFVHDTQTGDTIRVSLNSNAVEGNGASDMPTISADGLHVAYRSIATNLIADDTNGVADVFIRDLQTGKTRRVSVSSAGVQSNGASPSSYSAQFSISADGKFVAFSSEANNLASGDANGYSDIFVHESSVGLATPPSIPSLVSPASGGAITDYTPTLDWANSTLPSGVVFDHYQVQVATDITFANILHDVDLFGISNSSYTIPSELASNMKYYWRVRSFNLAGGISSWSAIRNFRAAPTPPTLVSPADGFDALTLRPAFDWDVPPGPGAITGYSIQFSKNNTFTQVVLTGSPVTSNYTPSVDLPKGTALYWRVQAKGANGTSLWSAIRSINTANSPSTPVLSLPAQSALLTDDTPLLTWSTVTLPPLTNFHHYHVQVDDNADFSSPVVNDLSITDRLITQFTVSPALAHNTTFYLRVSAVNTDNEVSNWSAVRSFRIKVDAPTLVSPTNGFDALTLRPAFDWDVPSGIGTITGYTIQISKNDIFTQVIHTGNPVASNYTPTVDLPKATTLHWRVLTKGANGPSVWSAQRSFNSANSPSTPVLSAPALNALNMNYQPLFKWSAVTLPAGTSFKHYQLQLDDNSDFSSLVINDISVTNQFIPQFAVTSPLAQNTKFYWRVRAVNDNDEVSNWSATWYFRTIIQTPQSLTVTPNVNPLRPTFTWAPASGPGTISGYTIQISTVANFSSFLINSTTQNPTYTMMKDLPAGKTIYWRVRVNGANGPSTWASTQFVTPIP